MFDSNTSQSKPPYQLFVDNNFVYLPKPFLNSQAEDNLKPSQCEYQSPISEEDKNIYPEEESKIQEVKAVVDKVVDDDDEYFGKLFT